MDNPKWTVHVGRYKSSCHLQPKAGYNMGRDCGATAAIHQLAEFNIEIGRLWLLTARLVIPLQGSQLFRLEKIYRS